MVRRGARLALLCAAVWALGRVLARRLSEGDERSDEFAIATIFGGRQRTTEAQSLRTGRALACCGGIDLDLRAATLDPGGAILHVTAVMGGVQVTVPSTWRVEVEPDAIAGGIGVDVAQPEDRGAGAPTLRVIAVARMGGVAVTTGDRGVAASSS